MKLKKILIAIDDSPFAEHAAAYGFDIAYTYNAKVGLVHIVEPMVMPVTTTDPTISSSLPGIGMNDLELLDIQNNAGETLIEKTIKKFAKGLEVTQFNEFGSTADGILACSEQFKADLVVVGTHSRTGLDRFLMGSIAEEVIRHSLVPVLVVPMKEHESR